MRISDWSSDVCSSDLPAGARAVDGRFGARPRLSGGAGLPAVHRDALRPRQSARRCPLSALRSAGDRVMSGRAPKILGFGLVGLLLLVILTGFVWLPYDPLAIDLDNVLAPPSWAHWLGTDQFGRDVAARAMLGARISAAIDRKSTRLNSSH